MFPDLFDADLCDRKVACATLQGRLKPVVIPRLSGP